MALPLFLQGCASIPAPEFNPLPDYAQEEARTKDPRLQQLYEKYHPVPGPGYHIKTDLRKVNDQRTKQVVFETWVYVSWSW